MPSAKGFVTKKGLSNAVLARDIHFQQGEFTRARVVANTRFYAASNCNSIEDSPSQVGLGGQDHLRAKASSVSHLIGAAVDDILPPGFEEAHSTNHLQINLLEIPVIKWRCPLRFVLDLNWQVVAGEESKEVEVQNQREPFGFSRHRNCQYNDQQTPQIPITPIEDEDAAIETPLNSQPQMLPPAAGMVLNVEPGVAAINQINEPGNMIDLELLVKVLSNPGLIEKLITDYEAASGAQNLTESSSPLVPSPDPPPPVNHSNPVPTHIYRTGNGTASLSATYGGAFYAQPYGVGVGPSNKQGPIPSVHPPSPAPAPAVGLTQTKDLNYYKNLIQ
ncbi:Mitochondrial [Hibiscus syriacus]|uniref:Mitochondrial n=1 Tax=Hibiscus syriacus TaxID=106335 RepID=A0A6A3BVD6_HIBSY|nr:Mitochondrial [Hibiscus syriacus]